jgi:hypothetical protein
MINLCEPSSFFGIGDDLSNLSEMPYLCSDLTTCMITSEFVKNIGFTSMSCTGSATRIEK